MNLIAPGKAVSRRLPTKLLRIMRLTAIFLLITVLHVSARTFSQTVSISGKGLTLNKVFELIERQTGYAFVYEASLLKEAKAITIDIHAAPLEQALAKCLEGQPFSFEIEDKIITIWMKTTVHPPLPAMDEPTPADTAVHLHGRVIDSRGQPIPNASVVIKRLGRGGVTAANGEFSFQLKGIRPDDSLLVSYVGYKRLTVKAGNKPSLGLLILQPSDNQLDETVVTAYGTTSQRYATGDVTTVKAEDIARTPSANVLEALEGRVPGLYITQNSANVSGIYNIQLRGLNSLGPAAIGVGALNNPLLVVDGLPIAAGSNGGQFNFGLNQNGLYGAGGGQDVLFGLNPADIESISVLKDAEATSLYGSRGANGVILITTKKGKPGKAVVTVNARTGVNEQARRLKLLNNSQYLAMRREAFNNDKILRVPPVPTATNAYDMLIWDTTRHTDWQKVLLGNASTSDANFELSGGENRTSYRLSAAYLLSTPSYPGVGNRQNFKEQRGNLNMTVSTHSLDNRFTMSSSVLGSISTTLMPGLDVTQYIFLAPDAPPIFDAKGKLNFADWRPAAQIPGLTSGNPFAPLLQPYSSNTFSFQNNTKLSYQLFRSLVFSTNLSYSRTEMSQTQTNPAAAQDPILTSVTRSTTFGNIYQRSWSVEPILTYNTLVGAGQLRVLAGGSFQSDLSSTSSTIATGYLSDDLMGSMKGAASYSGTGGQTQTKLASLYGKVSYYYADRYLLDLSGRRDGSSNFGPGHQFGNFGSIGAGWIFTQEHWIKKSLPFLSFGKLRGSYGITGVSISAPYTYLSTFTTTAGATGTYQGSPTLAVTRAANPDLRWTQIRKMEAGIDLGFFNDRLVASADWYRNRSSNQTTNNPVSAVTGNTSVIFNLPAVIQNTGTEASLGYRSTTHAGWRWTANFNIAINRNRLVSFPNLATSAYKTFYTVGQTISRTQLVVGVFNPQNGHYLPAPNGTIWANNMPSFTGGIQGTLAYKQLSLSFSITYAKQKGFLNIQGGTTPGVLSSGIGNQPVSILGKHWERPGDSTLLSAFSTGASYNNLSVYWVDASYISLKNAVLSYELPAGLLRRAKISALRVFVQAQNLVTLSHYKGSNAEAPSLSTQLPLRRLLVGGLSISL